MSDEQPERDHSGEEAFLTNLWDHLEAAMDAAVSNSVLAAWVRCTPTAKPQRRPSASGAPTTADADARWTVACA
jgi:hypothetical protein